MNEPIRLPFCCNTEHSVTLQPGEYVIELVDSSSDRHIVRVFDKDEKNVITTILAIPNYRLTPTSKTSFQYWEVPAGQIKAMRAWFYPGDNFGQEFAYPKDVAAPIANFGKAPVPVVEVKSDMELKTAKVEVVQPSGQVVEPVKVKAYVPPPAAPAPTMEAVPVAAEKALPTTASPMPLIGLIGLLSSAAFGISGIRFKRSVK